jgi:hypothetical protein
MCGFEDSLFAMYGIPGPSELGDWGFYRHDRCIIRKSGNAWTPESIPEDEVAPWHCPRYEAPCRKKHPCGSGWSGTGEVEKHGVALFWGSERGRDLDFEGISESINPHLAANLRLK